MHIKNLLGFLIGAIICFVIIGVYKNNFEWENIIIFIVGGIIGYICLVAIRRRKV